MSTGVPIFTSSPSFTGLSVNINRDDGQLLQDTATGDFKRWNAATQAWEPANVGTGSGGSGVVEQAALPSAAPADRNNPATIFSTTSNTTWQWDVQDQIWRTVGTVFEAATADIPANTWTNFPAFTLLATIESWEVLKADRERLTNPGYRRRLDGWPQIQSLHSYSGAIFEALGYGQITVP